MMTASSPIIQGLSRGFALTETCKGVNDSTLDLVLGGEFPPMTPLSSHFHYFAYGTETALSIVDVWCLGRFYEYWNHVFKTKKAFLSQVY